MAGQKNPFDQFDSTPSRQVIVTKPADPRLPFEAPLAQSELASRAATLRHTQLENAKMEQDAAAAAADKVLTTNSDVHGPDYLKTLPSSLALQVRGLADGRIAFPTSQALRTPYWQNMLGHVVNYDPEFDAVNYGSRAATRKDFTSGKSAMNIKALNTAIGHVGQLYDQIGGTASHGGFPFATTVNALENSYSRGSGDAGVTKFEQTAGAVASELTQVFRGSGGAEADVKRYLGELNSNASADQKKAAVQNIVGLLNSRLQAIGDQYTKGMGTTAQPLQMLDDHAQHVLATLAGQNDKPGAAALPGGGSSPPGGGPSGPLNKTAPLFDPNGSGGGGGSGGIGLATGGIRTEQDPQVSGLLDMMIRRGASADEINARLKPIGADPVDPAMVSSAQTYLKQHPDYKGSFGEATRGVPISALGQVRNDMAQSPLGTLIGHAGNAVTFDNLDSIIGATGGNAALTRAGLAETGRMNPKSALGGDIGGGLLAAGGLEAGAGLAGARLGLGASPWIARGADALYGGLEGAGANDDNRLGGAALGAVAGTAGGMFGRGVVAPAVAAPVRAIAGSRLGQGAINGIRDIRGLHALAPPPSALSAPDRTIMAAAQKAGIPDIQAQLAEAQSLGVPMSLADTHPELRSLAGAAVRRSPTASQFAENALIPRSRGQIDRLGQAVQRDLGPIGNIPQISADMTRQARTTAGPLYDRAYSQPVVSTPELDATLGTPFGRDALGRARTIAANERRSPTELGFAQDAQGNTVLNPMPNQAIANHLGARAELDAAQDAYRAAKTGTGDLDAARNRVEQARNGVRQAETALGQAPDPSLPASVPGYTTQTLDYVKRGMDDVLEQQRNPITGRLQLDEAGRAQNQVKNQFLGEVDRLNPAYRDARNAYAGPVQARDAMARGQDAFSLDPNTLGMQVAGQSPEHLAQMQLGYRDSLMGAANRTRFSGNPFDATLGTPAAEQRLSTLYPDNPGVANLLRTRDLEGGMARTTNDILGNSKTAQRGIADEAFNGSELAQTALDLGINAATGQVPIGTVVKGLGKLSLKDYARLGMGKSATAKADAIIPTLLNTNPGQSADDLTALVNSSQAYRDLVSRYKRGAGVPSGMFGAAAGAAIPSYFGSQ